MDDLEKRIKSVTEKVIQDEELLFLIDVRVKGNVGNQKVLVFIDGDNDVHIDHCSSVSRQLGVILEEEDFMPGKYCLEVSSPGLDHPIKMHRQYLKNKGRLLEVETMEGEKVKGKLLQVNKENIVLKTRNKDIKMNFEEINKSKIIVSFK